MDADTVKVLLENAPDLPFLERGAIEALAHQLDYRTREIVQEAVNFALHCKRTDLRAEDIDRALRLRNVEETYGFQGKELKNLKRSDEFQDVVFVEDKLERLDDIIQNSRLPSVPLERGLHLHWLAVEGVKPTIPENMPVKPKKAKPAKISIPRSTPVVDENPSTSSRDIFKTQVQQSYRHVIPQELQMYYEQVTQTVVKGGKGIEFVLDSVKEEAGLHPLVPYFTHFITKTARREETFANLSSCDNLLNFIHSLLLNEHIQWEKYLHEIIPVVITFLVRHKIGANGEDHWRLRRKAAVAIHTICSRLDEKSSFFELQSRIARILVMQGLMDSSNPLTSHYGSIVGVNALGAHAKESVLLPYIPAYLPSLGEALGMTMNPVMQYEAYQCLDALLICVGNLLQTSEYNKVLKERNAPASSPSQVKIKCDNEGKDAAAFFAKYQAKSKKERLAKVLTPEALRGTASGMGVVQAFGLDLEDDDAMEEAAEETTSVYGFYFDFGNNDFAAIPNSGSENLVTFSFNNFGTRILPFLYNEYAQLLI